MTLASELHKTQREVTECLSTFYANSAYPTIQLSSLRRAVEAQQEVVKIHEAIVEAYTPCRMCKRKVASPCHDAQGYYENGPWDFSCEDFVKGK